MDDNTKIALLKDEYLLLQKFYEDFDARIMTIKGWSATVGLAALGTGFYQSRFLWLFAAGAALVFWGIEAVWKSFQHLYAPRITELEEAFRRGHFEHIAPFQIYTSWFNAFRAQGFAIFLRNFCLPIVFFPHVATVITGVVLFVLDDSGVLGIPQKP